ncbi:hypothetical protein B0H17DRAFT_1068019 [Mycena rosella]|uniref:Uncharacterized protein n=1 Tax=Mycena rosella TaxID=1033263 RepID=A0AAD7DDJ2_MYCRO|nr:hypothetical protein B0H17DRAFT_1068019 [Mycena rosella]
MLVSAVVKSGVSCALTAKPGIFFGALISSHRCVGSCSGRSVGTSSGQRYCSGGARRNFIDLQPRAAKTRVL